MARKRKKTTKKRRKKARARKKDAPTPATREAMDPPPPPPHNTKKLLPWDARIQPAADEYMRRSLAVIRATMGHPVHRVGSAAALVYLLSCAPDLAPCPAEWSRREVYEEACAILREWPAPEWHETPAGVALCDGA